VATTRAINRIGIVTAMDEEFMLLGRHCTAQKKTSIGPRLFRVGNIGRHEVVLVRSRIGKVAAATTATILIHSFDVDAIFFTGVAGGIAPGISIGHVVVADRVIQHDFDLKGVLGYERFMIPPQRQTHMDTSADLGRVLLRAANALVTDREYRTALSRHVNAEPRVHIGLVGSGDAFVAGGAHREDLRSTLPDLLCVEMEGAAVAQVCSEHDIPCAIARIISDSADEHSLEHFEKFIETVAAVGSEKLMLRFLSELARGNECQI